MSAIRGSHQVAPWDPGRLVRATQLPAWLLWPLIFRLLLLWPILQPIFGELLAAWIHLAP